MGKTFNISSENFENGFSKLLLALYKLKDDENLATLSELPFILDIKNLLNFLEYYGGKTITIPKKEDLLIVTAALSLIENNYDGANYEDMNIDEALDKKKVLDCYRRIKLML